MRIALVGSVIAIVLVAGVSVHKAQNQTGGRPVIATEADFRRAMKELSNWGRWGDDDELGAAHAEDRLPAAGAVAPDVGLEGGTSVPCASSRATFNPVPYTT